MMRRGKVRGFGGRSWFWIGVLVVGLGYAVASGRWSSVVYLLLRVA